jgi:hypothetical protein
MLLLISPLKNLFNNIFSSIEYKEAIAMHYSPEMIKLISQARRQAANEDKPSIRLANPSVFVELNKIYHASDDLALKAIIEEAFELAGEGWPAKLAQGLETTEQSNVETRYIKKMYRGQEQLIEVISEKPKEEEKTKSKRVYRGQVVN